MLKWILERCEGRGEAERTAIGWVPTPGALDLKGVDLAEEKLETLLDVDPKDWREVLPGQKEYFDKFGAHTPEGLWQEHKHLADRVAA